MICDVIGEKVPYYGTNIVGADEHLKKTFLSLHAQYISKYYCKSVKTAVLE